MVDTSHSSSVRGTLSNPKTKEAMSSDKPTPRLGDHVSLKPENDDSKTFPSNDAPSSSSSSSSSTSSSSPPSSETSSIGAPTPSAPYVKSGTSAGGADKKAIGNGGSAGSKKEEGKEDLPHSKKVRGTLANDDGNKVNKTQLGDPASLKAETSDTKDMGRQTEREGRDKGGKSKL
ncbi:uncharacterized protein J4E78_008824 [Alternaria triticimaculans]|uniref:uncharacterized protein n=1 Tax=Alternaria triticimaculans TaxID=297637 RepID=UPI0020C2257E|nr:uncharacterized protein J4E78_008824 [Alternaria triticimaculans]KAI4647510.1 hypothetical protein J4E78_008824 [Alternaria triticimaculans]